MLPSKARDDVADFCRAHGITDKVIRRDVQAGRFDDVSQASRL